ncbi:MAG: LD-carboxypeptidase [Alphaproteobacteria bacterium]
MKKIAFVSPSSILSKEGQKNVLHSKDYFEALGYEVVLGEHIFAEHNYFAGTDKQRASDIMKAYQDKDVIAIIASRGGTGGCTPLLNLLDWNTIKNNPKPFIGFSEVTTFHNAFYHKLNQINFSGYMTFYNDLNKEKNTENSLKNLLANNRFEITSGEALIEGEAEGILIGGNLSVFRNLCGTEYFPDLSNKILLLEDVDEYSYKINVMLNQIKLQPNFNKLKGIIFGDFNDCQKTNPKDLSTDEFLQEFIKELNIPVIINFENGHLHNGYVVPIGKKVKLVSAKDNCKLII